MSDRIRISIYRDWQGLNSGNTYWKDHTSVAMHDIEDLPQFRGWLHFTDIDTNPTMKNTYAEDAGVDGSRFEYNSYSKTQVKLSFYFEFDSYREYIEKKHDIQAYFSARAGFVIETNYHPAIRARCYISKIDIKPTSDHIAVFDVTLDNALGMWTTNNTQQMEERWNSAYFYDLQLPTSMRNAPTWSIGPGHNDVYIAGDLTVKMTNPIMTTNVFVYGAGSKVSVINHTNGTILEADTQGKYSGDFAWMNLDFGQVQNVHSENNQIDLMSLNQYSNALDFWLSPGWNDIELQGASSGYIDTGFYFVNI